MTRKVTGQAGDPAQEDGPAAQARLGMSLFVQGRADEALPLLELAAEHRVPEARNLLGLMYLNGIAVPHRLATAIQYLRSAADQGLKEACYTFANLVYNGLGVTADTSLSMRYMFESARQGHPPALRVLGILAGIPGATETARHASMEWLDLAARAGDGMAQYFLGKRCLEMSDSKPDIETGIYWLLSAATRKIWCADAALEVWHNRLGEERLSDIKEHFQPRPSGAALFNQVDELEFLSDTGSVATLECLSGDLLYQGHDVLPQTICEYLMNMAAPGLMPSQVVDPNTGLAIRNQVRTSSSMYFKLSMYDMVTGYAVKRLSRIAGLPESHAEPISLLRYLPGQEYKLHYDYFAGSGNRPELLEERGGQRIVTVFVYLNDVEAGGETDFPLLGARVTAKQGKVVKFFNCLADGTPNKQMLHAGMPVVKGEKWLATLWFREQPFIWGDKD